MSSKKTVYESKEDSPRPAENEVKTIPVSVRSKEFAMGIIPKPKVPIITTNKMRILKEKIKQK